MTDEIWFERMRLNGETLEAVAYGIFVSLVIQYLDVEVNSRRSGQRRWPMIVYVVVLFTLGTTTFVGEAYYNQKVWVDDRSYPGGPEALIQNKDESKMEKMATASCILLRWFSDALLIYRCYVIWSAERFVILVMALPVIAFVAEVAFGVLTFAQLWNNNLFGGTKFTVPDFSLSVSNNIIATLLIVGRLLCARRKLKEVLGTDHAKPYTSIAAMLIESAAIYSVIGLSFIVAFVSKSIVQNLVLPPLGIVEGIASMLIVLRVARGRAWSTQLNTTIEFASHSPRPAATFSISSSCDGGLSIEDLVSPAFATASQAEKSELSGESSSVLVRK